MGNKKILIVDDDPDVRLGMHLRLKANHYDTFFAADAFAAMAEARKHEPDLIILDLGLPAGDGFLVMERLKPVPSLAVIPIIVVSARDGLGTKSAPSMREQRPFSKNPWMMPNFWRSSGKPWENPPGRRNLLCMTRDPYDETRAVRVRASRPFVSRIAVCARLYQQFGTFWSMGWQVNCQANNASISASYTTTGDAATTHHKNFERREDAAKRTPKKTDSRPPRKAEEPRRQQKKGVSPRRGGKEEGGKTNGTCKAKANPDRSRVPVAGSSGLSSIQA